ncbi:LPXTG cell wall anchor domain-containing protein, partial [Streptomyces sp. MBT57]|nr:LPXTG cell wall anchor domain-containing protein [Streptomyces sp. MBT57]
PSASVPASASPSEVAAAPGGAAKVVDAAPAPDAEHDSDSVVPVAATAGLVAVIGGAAVFAAKRRRRAE